MEFFDVYVLRFDVNEERATRALMQVFGLSEAAARIFVHSVPRVGKRNVATDTAERYVRALHAMGAVVECRRTGSAPLGDNANRVQPMSLPAPATSQYPGASHPPTIMQDSLGIMGPLAYSPDMPTIPKAPRIPADLHAIRARKGPDSLAPNWRNAAPGDMAKNRAARAESSPQPFVGGEVGYWAQDPAIQISSDPLGQLESPFNRSVPDSPQPDEQRAKDQREDSNSALDRLDRVDHAALESPLSSPSPLALSPFAPSHPNSGEPSPWYMNATYQLLLACAIIGGMVLAMSSGVFETDVGRRTRAFQNAGIDPGVYEPAETYLGGNGNEFDGLRADQLKTLIDGCTRAGSRRIWIGDITRRGAKYASHTLLVELPSDPTARQTIFQKYVKKAPLRDPPPEDKNQRFVRLDF